MKIFRALFLSTAFYMSYVTSLTHAEETLTEKEQCSKDSNMFWDSKLNRCMVTEESMQTRNEYQECAEKESNEDKSKCLKALADKETKDISNAKSTSDTAATAVNVAFGGSVALAYLVSSKKDQTPCNSLMLAGGTGLASILGQTLYIKDSKKKVDDIRKRYENSTAEDSEDPYSTQLKAFQFLKEEQEAIAELAKKRKTMYYTYAIGYSGAIALVAMDWNKPTCINGSKGEVETSGDKASSVDTTSGAEKGASSLAAKAGLLTTPTGIAVVSAMGVTWNFHLGSAAAKQEKEAKSNAKEIQKIIEKFEKNVAGLCPEGREDMSNARCFCYTADNKQSSNRKNSQICQDLWAQDGKNYYVANQGLNSNSKSSSTTSCMTSDGQVDTKCKCRNFIDEDGNNACASVPLAPTQINSIASSIGTTGAIASMDGLTNGNLSLSNLSSGSLDSQAAKAKLTAEKVIRKLNKTLPKNQKIRVDEKFQKALSKKMVSKASAAQVARYKKATNQSSNRPSSPAISQALKKVQKKVSLSNVKFSATNKRHFKRKAPVFNFDDIGNNSKSKVERFDNAKSDYNYKENDIVNREDVSIWDVMSHRYQVSGLKRLFPDEK